MSRSPASNQGRANVETESVRGVSNKGLNGTHMNQRTGRAPGERANKGRSRNGHQRLTSGGASNMLVHNEVFRSFPRTDGSMNRWDHSPPYPVGAIANLTLRRVKIVFRSLTGLTLRTFVNVNRGWGSPLFDSLLFARRPQARRYASPVSHRPHPVSLPRPQLPAPSAATPPPNRRTP